MRLFDQVIIMFLPEIINNTLHILIAKHSHFCSLYLK